MGYKTVYIRESDKLRLYLDNLLIETKKGEIKFLISDLKILIIDNYKATLSVQLINKLVENNVSVILCDLSHLPSSYFLALNGHYASSNNIKKQIEWDKEMKAILHQKIVEAKINAQISILRKNNKSLKVIERIVGFACEVEIGDSTNREGLAAKMYFREMFSEKFIRFDDDIINAGLNYGYAILRSMISSILVSKGLLLNLGVFHKGPTNKFNLSDDIIEVFRPIVDDYVHNNFMLESILKLEHRQALIRLMDVKIEYNGKMQSLNNVIMMYTESILNCFEQGSINSFVAPNLDRIHDI